MASDPDTALGGTRRQFPTTRHSLVAETAGQGPRSREALDTILAVYWKPAYKHVRIQWKRSNEDAKDLVQGFFAKLAAEEVLAGFDPAKGRLRTWLRACLDHYVLEERQSAARLKRGGGWEAVPFDYAAAEREIASSAPSPEDLFLREWRREVFSLALADLRDLSDRTGKRVPYRIFEQYDLAEEARPSYAELAAEHGIPVTSVTNHLAWARRELRRLAGARRKTVTSGERERRDELRALFGRS